VLRQDDPMSSPYDTGRSAELVETLIAATGYE
jgi:hypothetical protein